MQRVDKDLKVSWFAIANCLLILPLDVGTDNLSDTISMSAIFCSFKSFCMYSSSMCTSDIAQCVSKNKNKENVNSAVGSKGVKMKKM